MFLKSLTLKGFKSFADTASLEFEPGVTVVVGPNGSGKSNVVDAVAWVLGAQGPRTVRSAKMEDVIFAGTPRRPALGRAEVSLTIDNSAGRLPIEFSEVTITRTLFRTGESEYAINKAPCRLLDVQDLLSDTGVGRQQHVIISQGNLDAILSSRPEDRRLVIEEAAGILKYRRRKERAERRLESTEASLVRLGDLLREVRRQLRPLERQAEAARRHGELLGELNALRRHLAGMELVEIEARLAGAGRAQAELAAAETEVRDVLADLEVGVSSTEGDLQAARDRDDAVDLAEALSRAEAAKARAQGLEALISERRRSLERELVSRVDADVVSSLESEAAALSRQLAATDSEAEQLLPQERDVEEAEAALQAERERVEAEWAGHTGPGVDPAAEVRAELSATANGVERARAELRRLESRAVSVGQRAARLADEVARLSAVLAEAEAATGLLRAAADTAGGRVVDADAAANAAEDARRQADAEHQRWTSRRETLSQALDEARARAGAERLAEVEGVVGTLLELVEVDDGFEAAFEAAAGEVIAAVVVDGAPAARQGLERLRSLGVGGAVVALPGSTQLGAWKVEGDVGAPQSGSGGTAGWAGASEARARDAEGEPVVSAGWARPAEGGAGALDGGSPPPLPFPAVALGALAAGVAPLRRRVRARLSGVEQLLDAVLAPAVVVAGTWAEAIDLAVEHPELVVVTRAGDRCARGVWRVGAGGAFATGAALEEAGTRSEAAARAVQEQSGAARAARAALDEARAARAEAEQRVETNRTRLATSTDALRRARAELADARAEAGTATLERGETAARLARDEARVAELQAMLPALEQAAEAEAERAVAERVARSRVSERQAAVAAVRRDFEVRVAGLEERRALTERRLSEVEDRLERNVAERVAAAGRREELGRVAAITSRLAALVAGRRGALDDLVVRLRRAWREELEATRAVTDRLEQLRRQRSAAEHQLGELHERANRVELEEADARLHLENLTESVRRDLGVHLEETRGAPCPPLLPGSTPSARREQLETEVRSMGPINPLALEEHAALEERSRFLQDQLDDVQTARRELAKVVRAIDAEIVEVFRAAYEDVAENFVSLFSTLFPGGEGQLRLTEPERLLETGIELEARPSGKNVRRLSLLSGGERSLVAMAFLFAVFRSRPSPFYLMDEVEAALDDINLNRFLELVNEFRKDAQLVIVSHQKRTMEVADCLYGVSMPPGGSSRVVSEKVSASAS